MALQFKGGQLRRRRGAFGNDDRARRLALLREIESRPGHSLLTGDKLDTGQQRERKEDSFHSLLSLRSIGSPLIHPLVLMT
jgi:hypothetical protein